MSKLPDKYKVISDDYYSDLIVPSIKLDSDIFGMDREGTCQLYYMDQSSNAVNWIQLYVRNNHEGAYATFKDGDAIDANFMSLADAKSCKNATWGFSLSDESSKSKVANLQYIGWANDEGKYLMSVFFTKLLNIEDWTPYFNRPYGWVTTPVGAPVITESQYSYDSIHSLSPWKLAMCEYTSYHYGQSNPVDYIGLCALYYDESTNHAAMHPGLSYVFSKTDLEKYIGVLDTYSEEPSKPVHVPTDPYHAPFPVLTQGPATLATEEDIKKDKGIYTHPDLHRRIKTDTSQLEDEVSPRKYEISVNGVDSYRTTTSYTHDEESVTREEP